MMTPKHIFFTKGVGKSKEYLQSFEAALRDAGIEKFNLVYVSSIFPPGCKIVPKDKGVSMLQPGQILHVVMEKNSTNEPNRIVSAAIGLALPNDNDKYGYLSEHHAFGETDEKASEYAEDLAATMLATTLDIEFDPDTAWDEREQIYKASGKIIKTQSICQSALGDKDGKWTTVVSAAVMIL